MNTENNKLIAEFMGLNLLKDNDQLYVINQGEPNWYTVTVAGLEYDTSWNWLMPVVEKIESLELVDEFTIKYDSVFKNIMVEILPSLKNTFGYIRKFGSTVVHADPKKLAVYQACLEFIKWYNTPPKTS